VRGDLLIGDAEQVVPTVSRDSADLAVAFLDVLHPPDGLDTHPAAVRAPRDFPKRPRAVLGCLRQAPTLPGHHLEDPVQPLCRRRGGHVSWRQG
jgi:hypothetical protein